MKVKFTATTSEKLQSLPFTEGQIIALSDMSGYMYDMGGERRYASSMQFVSALPESGHSGVVYVLATASTFSMYLWIENKFKQISGYSDPISKQQVIDALGFEPISSETDPSVPEWAKQPTKPQYKYSEIIDAPVTPYRTSYDLATDTVTFE